MRFYAMVVFLIMLSAGASFVRADTIAELQDKIAARNQAIADLEEEIAAYQDELEKVGKEADTLKTAIRTIELEQKKLGTDIQVTEERIEAANLTILELSGGIEDKGEKIELNLDALRNSVRTIERLERTTLVEAMLKDETLSGFWDRIDSLRRFDRELHANLKVVRELKSNLEIEKSATEAKRRELAALRLRLSDQRQILGNNRMKQSALLTETKSKESEYKRLLDARVELRDAFSQELLAFESELKFAIDPTRLPETGTGVLKWPLDSVKVTQYFGNTAFAKAGGYNGQGHNGIDLRAANGTPVRSAASGVVKGIGDTDTVCRGASYGKWVFIEHQNGLSTLYAHFSLIKVSEGQTVNTGEVIGYSGNTGYATGPHLHFTVYATQGVRIIERKSAVCKGTYIMPIADLKAYLNPISYL